MISDHVFQERISQHLKDKFRSAENQSGLMERSVRESIRILEGLPAAPSSIAMKHTERELKGQLSGYWHVHVAEPLFVRMFNNLGSKKGPINKSPTEDELIQKGRRSALESQAKEWGVKTSGLNDEPLMDELWRVAQKKGISEEKFLSGISDHIVKIIDKPLKAPDTVTGDWIIYWKDANSVRYYLDHLEHIDSADPVAQSKLKQKLDTILSTMQP